MKVFTPDDIIYPHKGKKFFPPFNFKYFALILLVLIALSTCFYTIQPDEVGVVQRWGKFVKITPPGLHFKLPFGIDKVTPIRVRYIFKEEFGFRTKLPGVRTVYSGDKFDEESLMLSGDLNVVDVEWIVQYEIKEPQKFLFNIRNPRKTLRDISESVMREVVGDFTFDEVLTTKRVEIDTLVQEKLQKILDSYQVGIKIVTVKLQDVNPPVPVQPAFNEVNEAKQEREKMINQAWAVYNKQIPEAKGKALKIIREAEGYATEVVNKAEGDAKRFLLLLDAYKRSKDITRRRIYLENMVKILKKAGKKYIIDPKQQTILPLLKLDTENE